MPYHWNVDSPNTLGWTLLTTTRRCFVFFLRWTNGRMFNTLTVRGMYTATFIFLFCLSTSLAAFHGQLALSLPLGIFHVFYSVQLSAFPCSLFATDSHQWFMLKMMPKLWPVSYLSAWNFTTHKTWYYNFNTDMSVHSAAMVSRSSLRRRDPFSVRLLKVSSPLIIVRIGLGLGSYHGISLWTPFSDI